MEKRLFQILDELNYGDEKNGTSHVGVCNGMISANMTPKGTKVVMGAPAEVINDLMSGKTIPLLLLVNREQYEKIKSENQQY